MLHEGTAGKVAHGFFEGELQPMMKRSVSQKIRPQWRGENRKIDAKPKTPPLPIPFKLLGPIFLNRAHDHFKKPKPSRRETRLGDKLGVIKVTQKRSNLTANSS